MKIPKEIWNDFFDFRTACRNNRVFPECSFISHIIAQLPKIEESICAGSKYYRARVYKNSFPDYFLEQSGKVMNDNKNEYQHLLELHLGIDKLKAQRNAGFKGYDEAGSFVCPDAKSILPGRCNHVNEQCLYMAEDVETAISEIKPLIREKVSVGCIEVQEALRIVDFSFNSSHSPITQLVAFLFVTSPTLEEYDIYTYTQIICSLIKKEGYDGVKYTSCQNLEKSNYAIFSFDKCKAISSDVYEVSAIAYRCTKD